ncbi:MAG: hypothetical protein ACPLWC_00005, partial [Candidatus Woesearchaeota archaeon]
MRTKLYKNFFGKNILKDFASNEKLKEHKIKNEKERIKNNLVLNRASKKETLKEKNRCNRILKKKTIKKQKNKNNNSRKINQYLNNALNNFNLKYLIQRTAFLLIITTIILFLFYGMN